MNERTRAGLRAVVKYGILLPLAVVVVGIGILDWTVNAAWVQDASHFVTPLIIIGFAGILFYRSLEPQRTTTR